MRIKERTYDGVIDKLYEKVKEIEEKAKVTESRLRRLQHMRTLLIEDIQFLKKREETTQQKEEKDD